MNESINSKHMNMGTR